jgi:hypothetical protein
MKEGSYTACHNCTKRAVGCHSVCEAYKAFAKSREDTREIKRLVGSTHYKFNFWEKKK